MPNDLHERVAAAILAQLETTDPASWTPPWHGADPMPHNARTGRRYRGINVLALWCAAQANGFREARWATYRQWAALGAQVRRTERGTLVLFYKDLPRGARAETGEADTSDGASFVARATHVFNAAQVDAAPPLTGAPTGTSPPAPLPAFDAFVAATSPFWCIVAALHPPAIHNETAATTHIAQLVARPGLRVSVHCPTRSFEISARISRSQVRQRYRTSRISRQHRLGL